MHGQRTSMYHETKNSFRTVDRKKNAQFESSQINSSIEFCFSFARFVCFCSFICPHRKAKRWSRPNAFDFIIVFNVHCNSIEAFCTAVYRQSDVHNVHLYRLVVSLVLLLLFRCFILQSNKRKPHTFSTTANYWYTMFNTVNTRRKMASVAIDASRLLL